MRSLNSKARATVSSSSKQVFTGISYFKGIRLSQLTPADLGIKGFIVAKGTRHSVQEPLEQEVQKPDQSVQPEGPQAFSCDRPDFFVSHSWHDDPDDKWNALEDVA